jgi:hypothetical protein
MFKEVKKISSDPNKIKNQIKLNTIAKNSKSTEQKPVLEEAAGKHKKNI